MTTGEEKEALSVYTKALTIRHLIYLPLAAGDDDKGAAIPDMIRLGQF